MSRSLKTFVLPASPPAILRNLDEARDRDLNLELSIIGILTRIFHGVPDMVVPVPFDEQQQELIPEATSVHRSRSPLPATTAGDEYQIWPPVGNC